MVTGDDYLGDAVRRQWNEFASVRFRVAVDVDPEAAGSRGRVRVAGAHTGEDGVGSREGLDEFEVVEDGECWQATRGGGVGALEEGLKKSWEARGCGGWALTSEGFDSVRSGL